MRALRWIGAAEAASYVFLLAVAMPLKYGYGSAHAVKYGGMIHGLLFVAYLVSVALVARTHKWGALKIAAAGVAAMIPFGTSLVYDSLRDASCR